MSMGDQLLELIRAIFVANVLLFVVLIATGCGSITLENPKTGKKKTWGELQD